MVKILLTKFGKMRMCWHWILACARMMVKMYELSPSLVSPAKAGT